MNEWLLISPVNIIRFNSSFLCPVYEPLIFQIRNVRLFVQVGMYLYYNNNLAMRLYCSSGFFSNIKMGTAKYKLNDDFLIFLEIYCIIGTLTRLWCYGHEEVLLSEKQLELS